jgi:hypothetical protein
MVDQMNPTEQFHPYQPETSIPASERVTSSGLSGMLNKIGISPDSIRSIGDSISSADVRGSLEKGRAYARKNPGMILGGLAALAIAVGLMRGKR